MVTFHWHLPFSVRCGLTFGEDYSGEPAYNVTRVINGFLSPGFGVSGVDDGGAECVDQRLCDCLVIIYAAVLIDRETISITVHCEKANTKNTTL